MKVSGLTNNITVTTGKPDMCNPNGHENISTYQIIEHWKESIHRFLPYSYNKHESLRKWLFLENEGTIYRIVINLIQNVLKCNDWKKVSMAKKSLKSKDTYVILQDKPHLNVNLIGMCSRLGCYI